MLSFTLKRSRAETYARFHPTPIAVVVGALGRAWARLFEPGRGGRRAREGVCLDQGDLDSLLARHDVRRWKSPDGTRPAFKAPSLVYAPVLGLQPVRERRAAVLPVEPGSGSEHYSRLFKPLR